MQKKAKDNSITLESGVTVERNGILQRAVEGYPAEYR